MLFKVFFFWRDEEFINGLCRFCWNRIWTCRAVNDQSIFIARRLPISLLDFFLCHFFLSPEYHRFLYTFMATILLSTLRCWHVDISEHQKCLFVRFDRWMCFIIYIYIIIYIRCCHDSEHLVRTCVHLFGIGLHVSSLRGICIIISLFIHVSRTFVLCFRYHRQYCLFSFINYFSILFYLYFKIAAPV